MRLKKNEVYNRERFLMTYEMYEWDETNKHLIGIYNHNDCRDILTKEQVKFDIQAYKDCIKFLKEKLKEMK